MADASCGPSNALQNFKSHTSVDRTLQQDRIISRHQLGQGFRSHDPNTAILDPEFDAFQASQPTAFTAGAFPTHDSLQPFHHQPQYLQHAAPSHAGPSTFQPPPWAADFQNLQMPSSPSLHQQTPLAQNPAWANQFQQTNGKSRMDANHSPLAMQYNSGPAYTMNRNPMAAFQQNHFQPPLQQSQPIQPQKDEFDEAAFAAAFDAAMEDASQSQDLFVEPANPVQSSRSGEVDIYPHLPLVRLALLKAIIDGSDYSLHEAAIFVQQLRGHDHTSIDPIQAMLLRPLIARLADQTRSPFAQRYQMTDTLLSLDSQYELVEKNAHITPENEQLLAAYADVLWGRGQPDHLHPMPSFASNSDWLTLLKESTDALDQTTHPTTQAMNTLKESNLWGLETPDAMQRVQHLELQAYRSRPFSEHEKDLFSLPPADDPQSLLFDMAQSMADIPELQQNQLSRAKQGLESDMLRSQDQNHISQHALPILEHHQGGVEMSDLDAEHIQQDDDLAHTEAEQPTREDDELANTAAELLGKMSHEKSDKFKNSAFLGLMRQLADREVKVEGDKIVETRNSQPSTYQPPAAPTTWSQSGPMQTPSYQQHTFPTDGQDVVDLLSQPGPLHLEDENTTLPTDNQEPMHFDASFITDQGMSAPTTSTAAAGNTALSSSYSFPSSSSSSSSPPSNVQQPSFPSWAWADSI